MPQGIPVLFAFLFAPLFAAKQESYKQRYLF